jgi:predicted AAA+ superfamily ATPase
MFDQSRRANVRHALEPCIMLELERRGAAISYIRNVTGSEVDFLASYPDGRRELIQVCAEMEALDVRDGELQGTMNAGDRDKTATGHVIVLRPDRPEQLPKSIH